MSLSSPRRELTDGSSNNSPKLPSNESPEPRSSNCLWASPSRKSISSPPKRVSTSPTFSLAQDTAYLNCTNQQRRSASLQRSPHAANFSPVSSRGAPPGNLMHHADSSRRIRLGPRISNESRIDCKPVLHSSYTEDRKGILHPRVYKHMAVGSSSSDGSNSFTMTPNVMFSEEVDHQQIQISSKRQDQQFHHSPHWTGKVRINPFSPVPPKYLEPPSSTKSLPKLSDYVEFPVLTGKSLSQMQSSQDTGVRRSRRLNPKANGTFPLTALEDNASPTDVVEGTFDIKSSGKRKSDIAFGLPQSVNEEHEPPKKEMKSSQSRYLNDFEQIRHLGSGSFGSVNACLSRLDGCMYAIKSLSPHGIRRSNIHGYGSAKPMYGGRKDSISLPRIPPTPRRDARQSSNLSIDRKQDVIDEGTRHWTDAALKRMLREVHALAALCNQSDIRTFHIVRYHQAWFENDGSLYIQTELCSSTLRDEMNATHVAVDKSDRLASQMISDASQRFKCLRELLLALQLIHSKGMVHLDIKPDNVFVQNGLYKLGDFGLAGNATSMDADEGDSRYMSRDMLQGGKRDLTKCDIFSLGATMYELCHGQTLPSCGAEWHDVRNGKLSPFWPLNLYHMIKAMMHPDPDERPSASDLLSCDDLCCIKGDRMMNSERSSYDICLNQSEITLKRSASWTC